MLEELLSQSDPANAVLLVLLWRRLDRRISEVKEIAQTDSERLGD